MTEETDWGHQDQSGYHTGNVTARNKHKNHTCNKGAAILVVRRSSETFIHNN